MTPRPISVFWFKNLDQYESCKEILTDSWVLPDDYRDWLIRFNQMIDRYERSGIEVIKVEIEPNEFSIWCLANGCEISTKSCNDFAFSMAVARRSAIEILIGDMSKQTRPSILNISIFMTVPLQILRSLAPPYLR